jgi:hypothetical protein
MATRLKVPLTTILKSKKTNLSHALERALGRFDLVTALLGRPPTRRRVS